MVLRVLIVTLNALHVRPTECSQHQNEMDAANRPIFQMTTLSHGEFNEFPNVTQPEKSELEVQVLLDSRVLNQNELSIINLQCVVIFFLFSSLWDGFHYLSGKIHEVKILEVDCIFQRGATIISFIPHAHFLKYELDKGGCWGMDSTLVGLHRKGQVSAISKNQLTL